MGQSRRFEECKASLARSRERDEVTQSVCTAALEVGPRVALFGVRKDGLKGLAVPGVLPESRDTITPISDKIAAFLRGKTAEEATRDLDLRMVVGLEAPVPSIFQPISVRKRTVLVLYIDRNGDSFTADERVQVSELCSIAGTSLELVIKNLSQSRESAHTGTKSETPSPQRSPSSVVKSSFQQPPTFEAASPDTPIVTLIDPLPQRTSRGKIEVDAEEKVGGTSMSQERRNADIDKAIDTAIETGHLQGLDRFGRPALARIAGRFPGELSVINDDVDNLPAPSAHGPLIRLVIQLGTRMTPYLIPLTTHRDPRIRLYAGFVFQELRDDACVHALSGRAMDHDPNVRVISMRVLETYRESPKFTEAVAPIRECIHNTNRVEVRWAITAVGVLRDEGAIPQLIERLARPDEELSLCSLASLCSVTGQQHGRKPAKWRSWYQQHRNESRIEWLMSALTHRDTSVRAWIADELIRVTGETIPFPANGGRSQREAARGRWSAWWNREGRRRFTPRSS